MKQRIISRSMSRDFRGQGIVEGVVGTWLIVTVGIMILLLLINVGFLFLYQDKANRAANEAARHINNGQYWLGMERPDFETNRSKLETEAKGLANATLAFMGMPELSNWHADPKKIKIGESGEALVVKVSFDVSGLRAVSGSFFPPFLTIKASGIASEAATLPYAMAVLNFQQTDPSLPTKQRAVRFPIYCITSAQGEGANHQTNPRTESGRFPGGEVMVAYMGILNTLVKDPLGPAGPNCKLHDYTQTPPDSPPRALNDNSW